MGRGHSDDILHEARLSPYASLASLDADERERLLAAVHVVLERALGEERKRTGFNVMLFLIGFTTLLYFTYRRVWHGHHDVGATGTGDGRFSSRAGRRGIEQGKHLICVSDID